MSLFASLAHQLRFLDLDPVVPSDIVIFEKLSNLEELRVACPIEELKTQLSILAVSVELDDGEDELDDQRRDMELFLSLLDSPSLLKLACFEFLRVEYSREKVEGILAGRALIQVLEQKGVKIIYGDV